MIVTTNHVLTHLNLYPTSGTRTGDRRPDLIMNVPSASAPAL